VTSPPTIVQGKTIPLKDQDSEGNFRQKSKEVGRNTPDRVKRSSLAAWETLFCVAKVESEQEFLGLDKGNQTKSEGAGILRCTSWAQDAERSRVSVSLGAVGGYSIAPESKGAVDSRGEQTTGRINKNFE